MRLIRILKYDLCREVAAWVGEEIISSEQAESICSRYGVDYHNLFRRSYGYHVLAGLGFLFIGLSLITLVGANWDEIPRAIRMSGLLELRGSGVAIIMVAGNGKATLKEVITNRKNIR